MGTVTPEDPTGASTVGTARFWNADAASSFFKDDKTNYTGTYNLASYYKYTNRDGLDLIWNQKFLSDQMDSVVKDMNNIEANSNLTDTEKMYLMQMSMNGWAAISQLRTNMLKSISDTLKTIVRNIA